jgi:hypothetical protein
MKNSHFFLLMLLLLLAFILFFSIYGCNTNDTHYPTVEDTLVMGRKAPCPQKGNSPSKAFQRMDSLKNRNILGIPDTLDLGSFLAFSDDRGKFSQKTYAVLTGYVQAIKPGEAESCNCNTQDPSKWDLHICLSTLPVDTARSHVMVAELTPYSYKANKLYHDPKWQKSLVGKKVTITGWLFWDYLHFKNAINTARFSPIPDIIWRQTCWEIHPITNVVVY